MNDLKLIHDEPANRCLPPDDPTVNTYYDVEQMRRLLETSSCYDFDRTKIIRLVCMIQSGMHLEYSHPRFGLVKHKNLTHFITSNHGLSANPTYLFFAVKGCVSIVKEAKVLLELFKSNGFWYPAANHNVKNDRPNHRPAKITQEQVEQIHQLKQQDMTLRDIATVVGLSRQSAANVLSNNCYHDNSYLTEPESETDKRPSGRGTSNDYQFARLRRDNPELATAVETGEKSIYQASVESGARRRVLLNLQVTEATSMERVYNRICGCLPPDKLQQLAALFTELASNKHQTSSKQPTVDITN